MKLSIEETPKEIADLVVQVQGQRFRIGFSPAIHAVNVPRGFQEKIQKHRQDQCKQQEC